MRSISILGCGWLGLPLGIHLANAGYQVKGSTTNRGKLKTLQESDIEPYHLTLDPTLKGDVADFFDSDVLLVNLPPRNQNHEHDFHERQLKAIYRRVKSKYVIFISSTAVYPSNNQEVTEADADEGCLSRGGIPLLKMEQLFCKGTSFKTTIIRFGGLYGPDRHPGRFLAGKRELAGANNPVNMIHLKDCIGVIQTILEQNLWGKVLNASAPSEESRRSFYEKAAKEIGLEVPTFSNEPATFKKVNSEKLLKLTGYRFKH